MVTCVHLVTPASQRRQLGLSLRKCKLRAPNCCFNATHENSLRAFTKPHSVPAPAAQLEKTRLGREMG